jgi:hypothetical protein
VDSSAVCRSAKSLGLGLLIALGLAAYSPAQPSQGARYLIIAPDSFVAALQPLAQWKTEKGMLARIVTLDQTGATPQQVRSYIRNAWESWPVRPEYVLIACSPAYVPGYTWDNDCYYGNMVGDYHMEISVGRLPAENVYECRTMTAKTLAYEQPPTSSDTCWYREGTTCVSEDLPGNPDQYYLPDSRFVRELWQSAGYLKTESLYNLAGDSTPQLIAALNEGRSFITYRGPAGAYWFFPFGIWPDTSWVNRGRLPILVGATCETVTLYPGQTMFGDESVRFGSPEALGGAVAYLGTTRSWMSVSHFRSAVFRGLFTGLFTQGLTRLGPALERGRLHMDSLYPDSAHYEEWTLLGDPELSVWTSVPHDAQVSHPGGISPGAQTFPVTVFADGVPRSGALVCVSMATDTAVYTAETTDASGVANLFISPTHTGLITIVATGRNLRPYQGRCVVFGSGGSALAYLKHRVNDSPPGGNGDSLAGQGETVRLPLWLVNYGDSSARTVVATLATLDSLAQVLDSVQTFGSIPGHDSARTQQSGYRVRISPACPDAHVVPFSLACADSLGTVENTEFQLTVSAPILDYDRLQVMDSSTNNNGRLDPGETAELVVTLRNTGHGPAESTRVTLHSSDSRLTVLDSFGFFGIIPGGNTGSNASDRFLVSAALMLPETEIPCVLSISARDYQASASLIIRVGQVGRSDPIPDGPRTPSLYYAYDDVDSLYPERPQFDWQELRDTGAHVTFHRDSSVVIALPFTFNFYGQSYHEISICNNGFIVPGASSYCVRNNILLPAGAGVPILAVNWDAFAPMLGHGVWYQHDPASHRFIVEWDSMVYRTNSDKFETFEVVIYDSTVRAHWGCSVFTFQYLTNNLYVSSTVGMQDQTVNVGVTSLFNAHYDRASAYLAPGRAIKFTTNAPFSALAEKKTLLAHEPLGFSLAVLPNPVSANALVRLSQPEPARVSVGIYDASGRLVSTLANRFQPAGTSRFAWNGLDESGRRLPQGIYICRARAGASALSIPVVLLH